jgi:hypothetical protein
MGERIADDGVKNAAMPGDNCPDCGHVVAHHTNPSPLRPKGGCASRCWCERKRSTFVESDGNGGAK